ncbi:DUF72 domain-containing protein [Lysobacter arvi]|uniref:DUF72 domain-containing protein n=1 Tax=Lysobacter arvi TaxID=3038776 RepID=A0ABU1CAR8_9GAMM|nr:DUF72 domain-containing protein [Lysobacter arvi]MDR0182261.1 DUF72 domain-containing protein [Lysobacter arvi]
MSAARGRVRIGISGWRYAPWRGVFYPQGLAQRRELEYASRCFHSIEINGTFYSLQRPESFRLWRDETPEEFVFAVKGSRYLTHMKRLKDIDTPLASFFAQGLLALGPKLGPILWQLPPHFHFNAERLRSFFQMLPTNTSEAATLARRREVSLMKGRSVLSARGDHRLRHALEVRHESFLVPECTALLREFNVALVVADTARKFPFVGDVTADFVYVRLHGDEELYASGYGEQALDDWARRIRAWRSGGVPSDVPRIERARPERRPRDVYCYFDNDAKVRAPFDARGLMRRLGG